MDTTQDTQQQDASPRALRDRCLALFAEQVGRVGDTRSADLGELAQAANALDAIEARKPVPLDPPLRGQSAGTVIGNLDNFCADVWNATQDAGATTATGDAAVAAIRKVLGS